MDCYQIIVSASDKIFERESKSITTDMVKNSELATACYFMPPNYKVR